VHTGDVLVVSGAVEHATALDGLICRATDSAYSHVGLLVRNPPEEMWERYGRLKGQGGAYAGEGGSVPRDRQVYVFDSDYEADGSVDGPVLRPLDDLLKTYMADDRYGTDMVVAVRHLEVDEATTQAFEASLVTYSAAVADSYASSKRAEDWRFPDMVESVFKGGAGGGRSQYFCSELLARCYQHAGLLPERSGGEAAVSYTPKDFSSQAPANMSGALLDNAKLSPEVAADVSALLGKLFVTVQSAAGLRNADWMGKSDPYVVCRCHQRTRFQTTVINNNLNPVWNEPFSLDYDTVSPLVFEVFDKDFRKDESLGHVALPPEKFYPGGFNGELELLDSGKKEAARLALSIGVVQAPA